MASSSRVQIIKPLAGAVVDPYFRYWMPPLESFAEGKANRTIIPNMKAIATHIKIDPNYITKYIAIELGCSATYDSKTGRTSLGVRKPTPALQELVWSFNERYMKCRQCNDPELMIDVANGALQRTCNACGYNGGNVSHRATAYIISHPPRTASNSLKMKGAAGATAGNDSAVAGINVPFDALAAYSSSLAAALPSASSTSSSTDSHVATAEAAAAKNGDDEEWTTDEDDKPKEETKAKKVKKVKDTATSESVDVPLTPMQIVMVAWHKALSSSSSASSSAVTEGKKAKGSGDKDSNATVNAAVAGELKRLQLARSLHDIERLNILMDVISSSPPLTDPLLPSTTPTAAPTLAGVLKTIRSNLPIMRACVGRGDGMSLLLSCERFVGTHALSSSLITKVPTLLQLLYDGDIIDEATLLSWHVSALPSTRGTSGGGAASTQPLSYMPNASHSTSMRRAATPFIEWLKQAESDDDEE